MFEKKKKDKKASILKIQNHLKFQVSLISVASNCCIKKWPVHFICQQAPYERRGHVGYCTPMNPFSDYKSNLQR